MKCVFSITFIFLLFSNELSAHGGRTNSQGCHNSLKTNDYHCHNTDMSQNGSITSLFNQGVIYDEGQYNEMLAIALNGKTEVPVPFKTEGSGIVSKITIDIENDEYVIEGGLDKRSSLDSIQQALFASSQTGKKPAVAIYDTDLIWGIYEHRIWVAAKAINVHYIWVSGGKVYFR